MAAWATDLVEDCFLGQSSFPPALMTAASFSFGEALPNCLVDRATTDHRVSLAIVPAKCFGDYMIEGGIVQSKFLSAVKAFATLDGE